MLANPKAVSRVSPSVVRITYYAGSRTSVGNGIIFSCIRDDDKAQFVSNIVTTSLLFESTELEREKGVASKLDVCLSTHELYEGELMVCDEGMMIVVIKIKSDDALPVATLSPFTDCISLAPFGVSESYAELCLSPYPTKLFPGDEVTIVCQDTSNVLVKSGAHSLDRMGLFFDGEPFLRINCEDIIDGAPVINCEGDVIGVAFNVPEVSFCVPEVCVGFLPVNIFFKWWKHVLEYGEIRRPYMGVTLTHLYATDLSNSEDAVHDCDIYDGVFIDEVMRGSPAYFAGMSTFDVISLCDGRPVRSLLEFFELMWDKSGEIIEAKGARDGCHFVWKVEIQAIKTSLVPQILAKSFAENATARKEIGKEKAEEEKKGMKDKEQTGLKARKRKMDSDCGSANQRKKGLRCDISKLFLDEKE